MSATLEIGKTPIFPTLLADDGSPVYASQATEVTTHHHPGMSLREHYAGLAMQGYCARPQGFTTQGPGDIAVLAAETADKLIAFLHDTE